MKFSQELCANICGLLAFCLMVAGVGVLFGQHNVREWCPFCKYINCVPTPWWGCDGVSV